jgi:hypothetical protein
MSDQVREFVVRDDTAAKMAAAAVRFAFTQRRMMLTLALTVGCATLAGGVFGHAGGYVAGAVVGLLLIPLLYLAQRRQMRLALTGRGYRPGAPITAEYTDDGFTVTSTAGSAFHSYGDIGRAAVYDDAVAMWLRAPRFVVVLPRELVPADCRLLTSSST